MSKYKTGDKVVLEIIQDDSYGDYKVGNETHSWWNSHELLDNGSVPLSKYIKSMEEKLHNQRVEINRLIEENKELKINANWRDNCAKVDSIDKARTAGQEEAWKLALKLRYMDYEDKVECFGLEYDGKEKWIEIMEKYTYAEAAAKVEAWERQKEEICVGDVLLSKTIPTKCIVISFEKLENTACILWKDGSSGKRNINELKKDFKKIGHIDIASMLAQIGGEE